MSAPMENMADIQNEKMCEIEATVVTGFEPMAQEEVKEKFGVDSTTERGKINFFLPIKDTKKILELRSVDNLYVVIKHIDQFDFTKNMKEDMEKIVQLIPTLDWEVGLSVWKQFFHFDHAVSHTPKVGWEQRFHETDIKVQQRKNDNCSGSKQENIVKNKTDNTADQEDAGPTPKKIKKKENNPNLPSFRATCYRTGPNHCFQSQDAAKEFGGAIQDYFCWNVDLKNFDIEVILIVDSYSGYVTVALTKQSQHRRNITHFGPTTLRSTIAYNMLRLCKIQPGDVVCDPMCGGGSIPIEAALSWPLSKHLCGDLHDLAVPRCQANINGVNEQRTENGQTPIKVDICSWDTTRLPLKDESINVFVTDLPFGKRSGSLMRNWQLYPKTLAEMARCSKINTGRAVLLTKDKKCFTKTLGMVKSYWTVAKVVGINIGGLAACVWCLNRTLNVYKGLPSREAQNKSASENEGINS